MEAEDPVAERMKHDAEWTTRHPRLDRSLAAAIRAPVVDARFDAQVWALIRADDAEKTVVQRRIKLASPWWLDCVNIIAVAVTAVGIALALNNAASTSVAEAAAAARAFVEQAVSVRSLALLASAGALWFGLRHAPFVRALVRA